MTNKISSLNEGIVSIVFGRESNGLTEDEVNCCSEVVTIATSEAFPSLNLSQAVQIITYNLFNNLKTLKTERKIVDKKRISDSI